MSHLRFRLLSGLSLIMNSIVIISISGLSAIPVFGLTGFHIGLVAMGRTTNEQVRHKYPKIGRRSFVIFIFHLSTTKYYLDTHDVCR